MSEHHWLKTATLIATLYCGSMLESPAQGQNLVINLAGNV